MFAIAATLLIAALITSTAATPARGQEVVPEAPPSSDVVPAETTAAEAPPPTVPDPGPAVTAPDTPPPPPQEQTTPIDGAPVMSIPDADRGGHVEDRAPQRQPSHDSQSAAAPAPTTPPAGSEGAGDEITRVDTLPADSEGNPGAWLGQDTFVTDDADPAQGGMVAGYRARMPGLFVLARTSPARHIEANARRNHATAQATSLGDPPGPANGLPAHNPFLNLLSGPGGVAAGLALASMLAVLGAAFVLPRDRSWSFGMPAVSWRPLAYVPPIELPG